jgi:hypothetical protein
MNMATRFVVKNGRMNMAANIRRAPTGDRMISNTHVIIIGGYDLI